MNIEDEMCGKWAVLLSNCASWHVTLYRFHQIQVNLISSVFWLIIELLIGELYNQGRCDRHARQLYGSVAGNSGDIFFATCFRQFMIFCAKFYFSAQMATMAIGNANPEIFYISQKIQLAECVCIKGSAFISYHPSILRGSSIIY